MASSPSQSTLQNNPLPSPSPAPEVTSPSSGGEFLLQLLQQGRPSSVFSSFEPDFSSNHGSYGDADALPSRSSSGAGWGGLSSFSRASSVEACVFEEEHARIHSLSRASSLEASVCDDEQARFHLQQDPAVAAMGPSHRVGEVNSTANSSININDDGRGILPFHDRFVQHQHHHQHHFRLQVPPSPAFDVSFPRPPPSEHMLPSPLDPLFRPAPNHFVRPYAFSHFPVVDHNLYLRVPSSSFPHAGLLSPNRLQEMACTFPYSAVDQIKPFQNSGIASGQNVPRINTLLPVHRSVPEIESPPLADQGLVPPKSPFYTQFGSIGVEIAHPNDNKDASHCGLHSSQDSPFFQKPSLLNERAGVLPSPLAPKGIVAQSLSPIGSLQGDGQYLSPDSKASTEVVASAHHQKVSEPVRTSNSTSMCTEGVEGPLKGPALPMGSVANARQVAETAPSKERANFVNSYIGASDSNKVSDGEIMHGIDCESNPRPKGPQKGLDSLQKGGSRNAFSHWVAVTKDKKEVASATRIESVGNPEELSRRSSDDVRKRRGQHQGWRMKQATAGNHAQSQSPDVFVAKPVDSVKMFGRLKAKSPIQQDPLGLPSGTKVDSAPSSATEQSKQALQTSPSTDVVGSTMAERSVDSAIDYGNEETIIDCLGFLEFDKDKEIEEIGGRNELSGSSVSEGFNLDVKQSDTRVARPVKPNRREEFHRLDVEKCTNNFLSIFQTLMPPKDEERRRKQLLATLDELVSGIWPEARLYLFGSCANAFGVCNSDIDVCLSIDGESSTRSEVVCTLADALKVKHMQNVQALTHARVPIVKYSDPTTGISCDVCVNNMLAVVNTKLLHDYAQIDVRLRQLAFMVKHWAKCRQVNETYRGTLSSYAYVLMCIHFLQQRKPPVLPCLQEMEPTYKVTVGDIKCAYFDRVDKLKGFGQKNKETLADLVTLFFDYWAFKHDYTRTVISIRTGKFISKVEKDWTRRIGNERHLICIEDPFEVSHDLGRVVDKHSIRVLRDEFQRAARIMRQDANPCTALFEPYIRQKAQAA